jgi:hypothetical protein
MLTRVLMLLLPASLAGASALANAQALPEGPGKQAVQSDCTACHELSRVTNAGP